MNRILIAAVAALSTLASTPALADRDPGPACNRYTGCFGDFGSFRPRGHVVPDWQRPRGRDRAVPWHHPRNDDVVIIPRGGRWNDDWAPRPRRWHDDGPTITLRIGGDARYGERFYWRSGYRFGPPPYGCEYRVINGRLVLVDSQTLQILAILGLLTALIN